MRVFCVFVFICALTWADDTAAAAAPTPTPATTTTKAPDAATSSSTAATTPAPTTPTTTTEAPTTTKPVDKQRKHTDKGLEVHEFLIASEGVSTDPYDCESSGYLSPTDSQLKNICNRMAIFNAKKDGFVYIKDKGTFHCCIDEKELCMGTGVAVESGKIKTCTNVFQCGTGHVCHHSMGGQNVHEQDKISEYYNNMYALGDVCCPIQAKSEDTKKCETGEHIMPIHITNTLCTKNYGRCDDGKKFGVCSRAKVAPNYNSACCKPKDADLCPGGLLPISLSIFLHKDDKGKRDTFVSAYEFKIANATTDSAKDAMKDACAKIEKDGIKAAYVHNEMCCPKGVQADDQYVNLVTGAVRISSTACKANGTCDSPEERCAPTNDILTGEEGPGKGKLCFGKLPCPFGTQADSTMNKENKGVDCGIAMDGQCSKDSVCVRYSSTMGMCCKAEIYKDVCKKDKSGVYEVEKDGHVVDIAEKHCVSPNSTDTVRGVVEYKNSTKFCCEWKKKAGNVCKNKGKYHLDKQTNNPLKCSATSKEGEGCEGKDGVCRKQGNSSLYCCDENLCKTDLFTPLDKLPECNDKSACHHFPPKDKDIFCVADKKDNNKTKCCPAVTLKGPKGEYVGNPAVMDNKIKNYKLEGTTCKVTDDCGGFGKYCDDSVCWNYGSNSLFDLQSRCLTNDDCKKKSSEKITYVCIKMGPTGDNGLCAHHKKVVAAKQTAIKLGYVIGAIVNAILAILFGLIAVVMFLKYRSKNFCDSRKPSKPDKKKKKESKTEVSGATSVATGTTGGTSTAQ